jgi:O-antigen ligase
MILILFAVWLIKSKKNAIKNLKLENWKWLIAVWLVIATMAVFISPNLRSAAGIWKAYFIEPILFLLVFTSVIKEKKDLELIFYSLGFSAFYVSAFAIYQKFTGIAIPNPFWQAEETRRVTSFYGYPNAIGLFLAPIVTLYFGWLISKFKNLDFQTIFKTKNLKKFFVICYLLFVIFTSVAAIIFARSEGAYFGIAAGLIFLGFTIKKLRWPTIMAICVLIIVILFIPPLKNYVWQQISFQNDSGKVRLLMWQESWQMLKDRPLFGAGLAGYQQTFAPYHKAKHIEIYLYPHNLFLNFWSELGIFGLIVFILIILNFFRTGFKNLKKSKNYSYELTVALMAAMVVLLVHGLVDVPYFKNDLSILFWLIIGSLTKNSPAPS